MLRAFAQRNIWHARVRPSHSRTLALSHSPVRFGLCAQLMAGLNIIYDVHFFPKCCLSCQEYYENRDNPDGPSRLIGSGDRFRKCICSDYTLSIPLASLLMPMPCHAYLETSCFSSAWTPLEAKSYLLVAVFHYCPRSIYIDSHR